MAVDCIIFSSWKKGDEDCRVGLLLRDVGGGGLIGVGYPTIISSPMFRGRVIVDTVHSR